MNNSTSPNPKRSKPWASHESVGSPSVVGDLQTPALVVDEAVFATNIATMAGFHPGSALRPHVKAFKSSGLAARLAAVGHHHFCAATAREIEGLVAAGLDEDLLLANELVDYGRIGRLVDGGSRVTVAVDSDHTIDAAASAGVAEVLIDVDVGLPRCGCPVEDAERLAERSRSRGLIVRGVMGYEGHLMMVVDPVERRDRVERSMGQLLEASTAVGGDVISAGGTGTSLLNTWATEIQAGSYCLMDTDYARLELPFELALSVVGHIISVNQRGFYVANAGLKAFGMDHGNPTAVDGAVMFCSDEHTTLSTEQYNGPDSPTVGELVQFYPAHIDPTVAKHQAFWVIGGSPEQPLIDRPIIDRWEIDLRHW